MIVIDSNQCIGCGLCAGDCFPGAIRVEDGKAIFALPGNCIGCGHCIAICPKSAVSDDSTEAGDSYPLSAPVDAGQLLGAMRSRRSCRHYLKKAVSDDIIHQLIEAAIACPTAKNLQATRFIVVKEKRERLLALALNTLGKLGTLQKANTTAPDELRRAENFIAWSKARTVDSTFDPLFFHAPALLIIVSSNETARDAAGAAAYAELMASSLGLGCLYSGYFTACAANSPEIQAELGLGPSEEVIRCLVLGYPDVHYQRTAPRKIPNIRII